MGTTYPVYSEIKVPATMGSQDLIAHLLSMVLKGALLLEGKKSLSSVVFIVLSPQNLCNNKTKEQC
jgi:hypothetical protein